MRFKSIIRYIVALSLIGFVAVAAYLSIKILIEEEKKSAAIINISGRQRMYSQRIALFANKSQNPNLLQNKAAYYAIIQELADSMAVSHDLLLNGSGKTRPLRNKKIDAIYFKTPYNLNQKIEIFLEEVNTFINSTDTASVEKSLIVINDFAAEQLLAGLNEVTFEYQFESDKIVSKLENRVTLAVVLILLLIILEAIFIFYPLARQIQKNEKDLTAQNKRLISLNHDLEQFIYAASHDLKTPIRGLNALIQFMEEDFSEELSKKTKEYLDLIKKRVNLSYALIDGLMRYGAISRERHIQTDYDLEVFIQRLVEETKAKHDNLEIAVRSTFPKIKTNPIWINEIYENLIENAIKHNDKEVRSIELSHQESTNFHIFCIKDNGKGVHEKYHDKIFKLFQTLENKEEKPAAGIGLAIVKKIITELGGKIWIESEETQHFTVFFSIPKIDKNITPTI